MIMVIVLSVLVSPLVLLALVRLTVLVLPAVRRGAGRELLTPAVPLFGALVAAAVAAVAYLGGASYGTYVLDPEEVCGVPQWGERQSASVHWESYVPLSASCTEVPGSPGEGQLIPGWANPLAAAGTATALVGVLAAPAMPWLRRRQSHQKCQEPAPGSSSA
jgi:hypothetical protein